MTDRTEPSTALAAPTITAPQALIDDASKLDGEQLLEILQSFHTRTTTIGAVATGATAAVAVLLMPTMWFAGVALIPAAVAGFLLSNRVVTRASAWGFGVTPRCMREVEVAFDVVSRRIDVKTMKAKDWFRTDWPRMVGLVKDELARRHGAGGDS